MQKQINELNELLAEDNEIKFKLEQDVDDLQKRNSELNKKVEDLIQKDKDKEVDNQLINNLKNQIQEISSEKDILKNETND